jgi:hypothetical protein
LLKFLPHEDVATMSILNRKWSKRVESYKIWNSLIRSVCPNRPKNTQKSSIKKVEKTVQKPKEEAKKLETANKAPEPKIIKSNKAEVIVKESKFSNLNSLFL